MRKLCSQEYRVERVQSALDKFAEVMLERSIPESDVLSISAWPVPPKSPDEGGLMHGRRNLMVAISYWSNDSADTVSI
jgi:hypothetical protein